MAINKDWEYLKNKFPDYTNHIKDKDSRVKTWIVVLGIIFGCFTIASISTFPKTMLVLSVVFTLAGTGFFVRGSIRDYRAIAVNTLSRWGYNKPLADDFLDANLYHTIGLILIVCSAVLQSFNISFNGAW